MATATYTKTGTKATTPAKLDKKVFGEEITNHDLLKQAYVGYLANGRQNSAQTMTRGLISGGGKKPWRQKGTGRARFGSSRNPIWRGGGVVFGPTGNENYTHSLTPRLKHQALRQALTQAANEDRIKIIEAFDTKERKVKPIVTLLNKMGAEGNILLVGSEKNDLVECSTRNLVNVTAKQAMYINVYEIMNADTIVISKEALEIINNWLGGKE